jgi:hypothetical protein
MTEMKLQCREGSSVYASPVRECAHDVADGKNGAAIKR